MCPIDSKMLKKEDIKCKEATSHHWGHFKEYGIQQKQQMKECKIFSQQRANTHKKNAFLIILIETVKQLGLKITTAIVTKAAKNSRHFR